MLKSQAPDCARAPGSCLLSRMQVFMVLLNFLLAIIVDAFSEVKEQTHETVGIHTELYQLGKEKLHSIMSMVRPNYISDSKVRPSYGERLMGTICAC